MKTVEILQEDTCLAPLNRWFKTLFGSGVAGGEAEKVDVWGVRGLESIRCIAGGSSDGCSLIAMEGGESPTRDRSVSRGG